MLQTQSGEYVPLKKQNLYVEANDNCASYRLEQFFENIEKVNPIEAYYTFPTPAGASVYSCEACLDNGTIIKTVCKEKDQAKREYNQAIRKGNTAYYMDKNDYNNFSVTIGNLAPLANVQITIKFVCKLDNELDYRFLRLNIPLTIADKYTPHYQRQSQSLSRSRSRQLNNYDEASQPTQPKKVLEKPYVLNIYGIIKTGSKLLSVNKKSKHAVKFKNMLNNTCEFELLDIEELIDDVIIIFERELSSSFAITQELLNVESLKIPALKFCTAINLIPDYSSLPEPNVNDCHYCFLLDRSGSMNGSKMINAKQATKQFVALIPLGASFDLYVFDDAFEKFTSLENSVNRKIEAAKWIDNIRTNGGTELIPVLKEIYSSLNNRENCVLIILTDGDVTNTQDVLKLVKANPSVSVFSVGVGDTVSGDLVKGLAEHGNGHSELIKSPNDIGPIVRSQLQKAKDTLRKHQNDYRIELVPELVADLLPDLDVEVINIDEVKSILITSTINVPNKSPPLYEKVDNTVFVFSDFDPAVVKFIGSDGKGQEFIQSIVPTKINGENMLHRIAGVKLINELQASETFDSNASKTKYSGSKLAHMQVDDDDVCHESKVDKDVAIKQKIIDVSVILSVLSKYTAFIGVDHRQEHDKVTGDMILKQIPLQAPLQAPFQAQLQNQSDVLECLRPKTSTYNYPKHLRGGQSAYRISRSRRELTQQPTNSFCVNEQSAEFDSIDSLQDDDESMNAVLGSLHNLKYQSSVMDDLELHSAILEDLEPPMQSYSSQPHSQREACLDMSGRDKGSAFNFSLPSFSPIEWAKGLFNKSSKTSTISKPQPQSKLKPTSTSMSPTKTNFAVQKNTQLCVVKFAINGILIGNELLTSTVNGSLLDLLAVLIKKFNLSLKISSIIQLCGETDPDHNGVFEIVSLGSIDEPWVLQRVN